MMFRTTFGDKSQFMNSTLEADLKRLKMLAYHRLDWSGALARKFHRQKKSLANHADFPALEKVYSWLLVPITLWAVDFDGLLREAMARLDGGKRLSKELNLLISMLPSLPSDETQNFTAEHEHQVQRGNYESLIHAHHKFDFMEQELSRDPAFQVDWKAVKSRFNVAKFQDHKKVIRRRMVPERSMRTDSRFRWNTKAEQFQALFDVFCQRWNLYGMKAEKPLLLKLTANLTPYGTMIFIPSYWSFDPKRDLNWHAITALHKARGIAKQGPKLTLNQIAQKRDAEQAIQLMEDATARGLKGDDRNTWVMSQLGWDSRNDDRKLRRLLKSAKKMTND